MLPRLHSCLVSLFISFFNRHLSRLERYCDSSFLFFFFFFLFLEILQLEIEKSSRFHIHAQCFFLLSSLRLSESGLLLADSHRFACEFPQASQQQVVSDYHGKMIVVRTLLLVLFLHTKIFPDASNIKSFLLKFPVFDCTACMVSSRESSVRE